jgi:hypothetical protein
MSRKVFSPNAELLGGNTRTIIGRISEKTKDTGGEETCDRHRHPGEPFHEKVDRVLAIQFKRRTSSLSGISPWVIVIQHVDEDKSEGPHIRGTRRVRGGNVVPAFVAHIGSGSTIHIGRLNLISRQPKVRKLYNDSALLPTILRFDPSIGDDKVLRLDVPMKDVYHMTSSDSLAHLSEHGRDEA